MRILSVGLLALWITRLSWGDNITAEASAGSSSSSSAIAKHVVAATGPVGNFQLRAKADDSKGAHPAPLAAGGRYGGPINPFVIGPTTDSGPVFTATATASMSWGA